MPKTGYSLQADQLTGGLKIIGHMTGLWQVVKCLCSHMASPTRWTWVWVNSGSLWWTGRPGVLIHGVAMSRIRLSNWNKLNWTDSFHKSSWSSKFSLRKRDLSRDLKGELGSNLGLLHCRRILYCLSPQGRPSREKLKFMKEYEESPHLLWIFPFLFLNLLNEIAYIQSPEQYLACSRYLFSDNLYLSGFLRITSLRVSTANSNCFRKHNNCTVTGISKL